MSVDLTKPMRQKGNKEPVRLLCTDAPNEFYPVIVLFNDGSPQAYTTSGRFYADFDSDRDLENIPVTVIKTLYVNVNKHSNVHTAYANAEHARRVSNQLLYEAVAIPVTVTYEIPAEDEEEETF